MRYRTMRFDNEEDRVSFLGLGCIHFPETEDGRIDETQAAKTLDTVIKAGVNYIGTAYPYHDRASEPFVGRMLSGYPRD